MSARSIELRIEKLEAVVPAEPNPLDDMLSDEMTVMVLERSMQALQSADADEEERAEARLAIAYCSRDIIEHANWRSGRWAKLPGFDNYQESLEFPRRRWAEKTGGDPADYVPALTSLETDGLGLPDEPVALNLMARRAALWERPIVKQLIADATEMSLPTKSIYFECAAHTGQMPAEPKCSNSCRVQCLNKRRGGFNNHSGRHSHASTQTTH